MIIEKDPYIEQDFADIASRDLPWDKLKNSTVLVTGATGLVGSMTVKALVKIEEIKNLGMKVLALVRNEEKAKHVFKGYLEDSALELLVQDITQPITTAHKADYIIHTAAIVNSKMMVTYPVETIDTSVKGTVNIFEYAKACDSKSVVYVSSMEIYGAADPTLDCVREENYGYVEPLNVRSCYPEGKRICECIMAAYHHEYGVNAKSARLCQIFGAGVAPDDTRVFAQFARSLINGEDIVLHTDGTSTGNYCYTADCVAGMLYILLLGENGQAYNVANEANHMLVKEMAALVASMSDGKTNVVFDIPEDALKYGYAPKVKVKLSGEKLRALGFEAKVELKEMYRRMIGSWQAQQK